MEEVPVPAAFDSTSAARFQSVRIPRQGGVISNSHAAFHCPSTAAAPSAAAALSAAAAPSAAAPGTSPLPHRHPSEQALSRALPAAFESTRIPNLGRRQPTVPSAPTFESTRIPRMMGPRKPPLPKLPRAANRVTPQPPPLPPQAAPTCREQPSSMVDSLSAVAAAAAASRAAGGSSDSCGALPTPPPSPPSDLEELPDAPPGDVSSQHSEKVMEQSLHCMLTHRHGSTSHGAFSPLRDPPEGGESAARPASSARSRASGGWLSAASPLRPASPPPPPVRPAAAAGSEPPRVFLKPERPRLTPKLPSVGKGGPPSLSRRARFGGSGSGNSGSFGTLVDEIDEISGIEDDAGRAAGCDEDDDPLRDLPSLPSAPHSATIRPQSSNSRIGSTGAPLSTSGRLSSHGRARCWGRSGSSEAAMQASSSSSSPDSTSHHTPSLLTSARTPGGTLIARIAASPACKTLGGAVREVRRRLGGDRSRRYLAMGANENWMKVRRLKSQIVLVRRWHAMVNRCDKRLWLEFKRSHTLLAGVVFRGTTGYTRAQTTQILINSLALELVVLCMMYSAPSDGPMVLNPITIIVSGGVAAAICIPGMLVFAMCFHPGASAKRLARCVLCWPCRLGALLTDCCRRRSVLTSTSTASYSGVSRRSMHTCSCRHRQRPSDGEASQGAYPGVELGEERGGAGPGSVEACAQAGHSTTEGSLDAPCRCTSGANSSSGDGGGAGPVKGKDGGGGIAAPPPRSPESLEGIIQRPPPLMVLPDEEPSEWDEADWKGAQGPSAALGAVEGACGPPDRYYSYASLNEHMLALSLRRCWRRKDWRAVRQIILGWVLNWALLLGLIGIFSTYGCEFYAVYADQTNGEMLLLSWGFSMAMRFVINEPFLILASKGVPMLFASAFCANLCGESIVNCLGLVVEGLIAFVRALTAA